MCLKNTLLITFNVEGTDLQFICVGLGPRHEPSVARLHNWHDGTGHVGTVQTASLEFVERNTRLVALKGSQALSLRNIVCTRLFAPAWLSSQAVG